MAPKLKASIAPTLHPSRMKLNYNTCLVGKRVILVPYRPEHVPTYHEWMKDPALLEATGSEPLSYEEEIDMQKSWKNDETKCTFIVHDAESCLSSSKSVGSSAEIETSSDTEFVVEENLDAMIGDVNLFLSEIDDSDESDTDDNAEISEVDKSPETTPSAPLIQAEVDIMIARTDSQGKGLGRAATCAMLLYGATELNIHRFFCRINEDNTNSIRLFKAVGFEQCNYAACFKQVELELRKPLLEMKEIFKEHGGSYAVMPCKKED